MFPTAKQNLNVRREIMETIPSTARAVLVGSRTDLLGNRFTMSATTDRRITVGAAARAESSRAVHDSIPGAFE